MQHPVGFPFTGPYDQVGNPVLKVTADGRHTMNYDVLDPLLSEDHPLAGRQTWTYDRAGNRLSEDQTQMGVRTLTNWTGGKTLASERGEFEDLDLFFSLHQFVSRLR